MFVPHTHTRTQPHSKHPENRRTSPQASHTVTSRTAAAVSPQLRYFFVRNISDIDNNTEFVTHASEINK